MNEPIQGPITQKVQFFSILGSTLLLALIIYLIRKGYLKAGYSIFWFLVGITMIVISISSKFLFAFADFIGVYYAPAALFLTLLLGTILILIHFSTVLSKHERQIKKLAQENGLLKNELEKSKKKV
jgi:hypothetical protein